MRIALVDTHAFRPGGFDNQPTLVPDSVDRVLDLFEVDGPLTEKGFVFLAMELADAIAAEFADL